MEADHYKKTDINGPTINFFRAINHALLAKENN